MTPPPSELRAEELFQLSHNSLAAISGSGCTDPDPPVTPLLSATVPFAWGPSQQQAFADLKAAVTSAPVLQPFRTNAQHLVMADPAL